MRVVVCAMAKNEHLYINEWVRHYIDLGVDHIYLWDNDDENAEYIGHYINREYAPKITIFNIRGLSKPKLQYEVYQTFYDRYNRNFDYCLICDIDEFLVGVNNIKTWLSKINAPQIRIKWRLFGDDGLIKRNIHTPVNNFFQKPITKKFENHLENQGKCIIKGGLPNVLFDSVHYAKLRNILKSLPSILPSGKLCNSGVVIKEDYSKETIYLNHYMTKTLDEFIKQKLNRNDAVFNKSLKLDYYWRINEKTQEKIDYLKERGIM